MNHLNRENVQEIWNLSPLQEDLLTTQAATQQEMTKQTSYQLKGVIKSDSLQRAWEYVVQSSPLMRSVLRQIRNRTVQIILKVQPVSFVCYDLRTSRMEQQRLTEIAQTLQSDFILESEPLLHLALCLTQHDQAVLFCTYHRIILDEQSLHFLLGDLFLTYTAIIQHSHLPILQRPPYKAYLDWLSGRDWLAAQRFWQEQCADQEDPTTFTMGKSLLEQQPERITQQVAMPSSLTREIVALSQSCDLSTEAVFQAAWAILLAIYCAEEHVTFGIDCHGRPAELDQTLDMIGPFACRVPYRLSVKNEQTITAFLRMVGQQEKRLQDSIFLAFHELQRSGCSAFRVPCPLRLTIYERDHGRYQNDLLSCVQKSENELAPEEHLSLEVQTGEQGRLTFVSSSRFMDSQALQRLSQHFMTILSSITTQPSGYIGDIEIFSADERRMLLHDFQQTSPPPSVLRLTHQLIEERAAQDGAALAALFGNEHITYQDLNQRANQLAHWLRDQGLNRNDLAAIFAQRSIDMFIAILAIFKAGGAYLPLDPAYPDARVHALLHTSKVKVILTQRCFVSRCLENSTGLSPQPRFFCLDQPSPDSRLADPLTLQAFSIENLENIAQPDDLAYVFYTSGSTGQPKGAMVEHRGMVNHLWAKVQMAKLSSQSLVVQDASHCFDISVWQFFAPLLVGGRVIIYPNEIATNPQLLFAALHRDQPTVLEVVPTMLDLLLQIASDLALEQRTLSSLEYVISSGEDLSVSLCRKWLQAYSHTNVINAYGATECSDDTTYEVVTAPLPIHQQAIPVGKPIPLFHHYIMNRYQRLLPVGCIGEICLAGIGVGRGYLHNPEQTQRAFLANPYEQGIYSRLYRTGDLGYFLPDGRMIYSGRLDAQVKVRGYRIELGEIEHTFLRHPAIRQCIALVRQDRHTENSIAVYIILKEHVETGTLRTFVATWLPEYMLPAQIFVLDTFPTNPHGKVDRKALLQRAPDDRRMDILVAPRTTIEQGLVEIWQDVLGTEQIGIDDTFFASGGNSLKTVQVRSRINKRYNISLDLRQLFEYQTIRQLAPIIEELSIPDAHTTIPQIKHMPDADFYPMSHAQRRLWFLQRLQPEDTSYNMPVALAIEETLDISALFHALQEIVNRHASLRTTFPVIDGHPVQHIIQHVQIHCSVTDLMGFETSEQRTQVARFFANQAAQSFDLTCDLPFRVHLIQLAEDTYILLITMHHIISDAWSYEILAKECATLYPVFQQGLPNPLSALPVQYYDYACWQNKQIEDGQLAKHEQYWLTQLADLPSSLTLPTDHPRPVIQTHKGNRLHVQFTAHLTSRLQHLARENQTTLFILLLTVTGVFLSRESRQTDIIVGSPASGRNQTELEPLIGCFINMLPLRLNMADNLPFTTVLAQVRQMALEAYTHQEYPFDLLVDKLQPTRDLALSPIFSVLFQVQQDIASQALGTQALQTYPLPTEYAAFDLSISFTEIAQELDCCFEYNTDLFENATIERMQRHLSTLLDSIVTNPLQHIHQLPLLTEAERLQLLRTWNTTQAVYPEEKGIHQLFEEQVRRTPEAIALVWDNNHLNYQELNRQANQLAHFLRKQGLCGEGVVGVYMERSPQLLIALLGILKAGGTYIPLDPRYPEQRLALMLEDAPFHILLTQQSLLASLPSTQTNCLCLDTVWTTISQEIDTNPIPVTSGCNLAYIIYTSGSTGKPKGVEICHSAVINLLYAMRQYLPKNAEHRLLAVTTLAFDIAGLEIYLPLIAGGTIVLASRTVVTDGRQLSDLLTHSAITCMQATPSTWRLLVEAGWPGNSDLTILCGGEAFPPDLGEQLRTRCGSLWNMYGPTETTIWSTLAAIASRETPITIGRPLANTQIYVLDQYMQLVPVGVAGEVYIGGAGVARGYLARPELTAERFLPDPFGRKEDGSRLYRTGDLARYLPSGELDYLGRIDQQVKIRGFRIEPGEIEMALLVSPAIEQAVVVPRTTADQKQQLVAYFTTTTDDEPGTDELRRLLKDTLPEYMVPEVFVHLQAFPLTPNGKIDRQHLPAPTGQRGKLENHYLPPRDQFELAMSHLWERVLQVQPVGVSDDFFSLGGHSLKAVELVGRIQERFARDMPLVTLFQMPTIAQLCTYLLQDRPSGPQSCLILLQEGQANHSPLFLLHPQGGGVLCYLHLTRALDKAIPVYGLQAPGYDSDEACLPTIEAMAERYIAEMKRVAPHGPYQIAGWSFGGLVAFEISKQLEAQGERVTLLGLLDTHRMATERVSGAREEQQTKQILVHMGTVYLGLEQAAFEGRDEEQAAQIILQRSKQLQLLPEAATLRVVQRQMNSMMVNQFAMEAYCCTGALKTDIHFFQSRELHVKGPTTLADPLPWEQHTKGRVYLHSIPGHHHNLVESPQVLALAEVISTLLTEHADTTLATSEAL